MMNNTEDLLKSYSGIYHTSEEENFIKSIDSLLSKDLSLKELYKIYEEQITYATYNFLSKKNEYGTPLITGISNTIYLPTNDNDYYFTVIGGKRNRFNDDAIDETTLFDSASITKLFTLILTLRLSELGLINLNDKISEINPDYSNLEDYTYIDLIRLHGEFRTDGNVAQASNKQEAYERLKTLYLVNNTREKNTYTDFGAIVLADTIEKEVSKNLGKKLTYDKILNIYLLNPLNMFNTMYNPNTTNLSGNGNIEGLVHDPKTRILGGISGAAGIFTNGGDLMLLAKDMFKDGYIISDNILKKLSERTFDNIPTYNKGNLGLYLKTNEGLSNSYVPEIFSNESFASQGFTGQIAIFDPTKKIHNSILANSICYDENYTHLSNNKPIGYREALREYQNQISRYSMEMRFLQEYYEKYYKDQEKVIKKIRVL